MSDVNGSSFIVVGVDGSQASKDALRWTARQARLIGAELRAVSAWQMPGGYGWAPDYSDVDFAADARKALDDTVADALSAEPGVRVTTDARQGHPCRVAHLREGFNFLGFTLRRYEEKLLTTPSKDAVKRIKARLAAEVHALRGANAAAVLHAINPIVRGWAAYYRGAASKATFTALDDHLWRLLYKWACYRHPGKPKRWITRRYFGQFHPTRQDQWVFGDRETGAYLQKFAWTRIVRHVMVKGTSSPDDPALTEYWAARCRKTEHESTTDRLRRRLLRDQRGRCAACGGLLLPDDRQPQSPEDWEHRLTAARKQIVTTIRFATHGPPHAPELHLIHNTCRTHTRQPATVEACEPSGLA